MKGGIYKERTKETYLTYNEIAYFPRTLSTRNSKSKNSAREEPFGGKEVKC